MKYGKGRGKRQGIISRGGTVMNINPEWLLFTWCPNVSLAVVFQVACRDSPGLRLSNNCSREIQCELPASCREWLDKGLSF